MFERLLQLLMCWLAWPSPSRQSRAGYPVPRTSKSGVAAIQRAARHARNRRRSRHV
ncbi:hypothetical protein [Chromobacterium sp. IIBBL 290-4]|uniref:hypothetical protein n=1 Tax=Chromobacterium sp. IIBBL 290-4 TaxID=2953890 RepID=UPI0020B76878|nr:hypothetical protein [Chromobacterium sp. IIBBL 290-4]UTH73960.1 hypothetical protein NKT35_20825 [Chromobacterium sp. IIBBL 290-4]